MAAAAPITSVEPIGAAVSAVPPPSSAQPDSPPPRERFQAIYEAHFDYVWRLAQRFGARPRDVEDLTHDVFMTAWRRFETYDPQRPIKPWLYGVAFRVVSDHRRRAAHQREVVTDPQRHDPTDDHHGASPERRAEARQASELVHQALEPLDPTQRDVFVMHELEGLSMPEIAEGLDVPLNTLYSRLRLARKRVRATLRRLVPAKES